MIGKTLQNTDRDHTFNHIMTTNRPDDGDQIIQQQQNEENIVEKISIIEGIEEKKKMPPKRKSMKEILNSRKKFGFEIILY